MEHSSRILSLLDVAPDMHPKTLLQLYIEFLLATSDECKKREACLKPDTAHFHCFESILLHLLVS